MPVTREAPEGDTESSQGAVDKGKTKVDKVVGKFIKKRKSYNIYFWLGVFI